MLTKVPIEFLNSVSKTDSLATVNTPSIPEFAVRVTTAEAQATNVNYLNLVSRLTTLSNTLARLESRYSSSTFKDLPPALSILGISASVENGISEGLYQVQQLRNKVNSTLTNIEVSVLDVTRSIADSLDSAAEYDDNYTVELDMLSLLRELLRPLSIPSYSSITSSQIVSAKALSTIVDNLIAGSPTDTYTLSLYNRIISGLRQVTQEYDEALATFSATEYVLSDLADKYDALLDRCTKAYLNVLNASYIKNGNYIRVRKQDSLIVVSAWKPDLTTCPEPVPLYYPPSYVVHEPVASCPDQPEGSVLATTTSKPAALTATDLLSMFKTACTLDDANYWTKAQGPNNYVSLLSTSSGPLNPLDASQYASGKAYWSTNKQINIDDTQYFIYGMGAAARASSYDKLVLGTWAELRSTYNDSVPSFYKCLYAFLKAIYPGVMVKECSDWSTFSNYCATNLPNLTAGQRVSVYLTYHWRSYVNVLNESAFSFLLSDNAMVQQLSDIVTYSTHLCQRFTFEEINSSTSIMGWALNTLNGNVRVINTEPDSATFNVQAQSPLCFEGGQFVVTAVDYTVDPPVVKSGKTWNLEFPTTTDPTKNSGVNLTPSSTHKMIYTAVHESAHTIDYGKGMATSTQFGFSLTAAWMAISGWYKSGSIYMLDMSRMVYPSKATTITIEPPVTTYGHTSPWEDFAESWAMYVLNKAAMQRWYPKRYTFMETQVKPYLLSLKRTALSANPS